MNRALFLLPLALVAAGPGAAQAPAAPTGTTSALKNHDTNAPVDVAADRIELQDRADRAVFTGNVKVKQAEMTMDAPRMTVAYARTNATATSSSDTQVQRIDASGGVVVTSPTETAKGNFGIYDVPKRLVTLIGNVHLIRGTSNVDGARLVIDLTTGKATVDGRAAGGGGPAGVPGTTTSGGRVTGRFTVPPRNQ